MQRIDWWLSEEKGVGSQNGRRGSMVKDGNQTFGSDHFVVHRDVKLYCCTPESDNVIHKFYLN